MSKKPRTLWRLCRYLWQHKWLLLMALVLTIGSNSFALVGPELSGKAINAREGLRNLQLCEAAHKSAQQGGKAVKVK